MALHMQQRENRSELQQRIDAELREKFQQHSAPTDSPDLAEYSEYLVGTKSTTTLAWIWVLIIIALVGLAVYFVIESTKVPYR